MPKNHSRYTWGQAGADIGTCVSCREPGKVINSERECIRCSHISKTIRKQFVADAYEQGVWSMNHPNLDRIRAREGQ